MWIFLNDSFISCVENRDNKETLCVRARRKGDIETLFPNAEVSITPKADYRFRAVLSKVEVAKVISDQLMSINYDNFKNSVIDDERHRAYERVWGDMWQYQQRYAVRGS